MINYEYILNLNSGTEMDMLVATMVFNGKPHPNKNKIMGQSNRYVSPLHYSVAIMSAWKIVEKISKEWDFAIINNQKFSNYPGQTFGFRLQRLDENNHIKTIFALGKSVPLAICRGSLLSVI